MQSKKTDKKAESKSKKNQVDENKTVIKSTEEISKDEPPKASGVYRVSYNAETRKWQIKRDGADRVIDSKVTKEEAMKRVKELSKNQDVGFTVKKKDGKFQKKN